MRLNVTAYIARSSPVHQMDARVKVCLLAAWSVALLLARSWAGVGLAALALAAVLAASRLPAGRVLAAAAPVYAIAAFAVAFNALSGSGEAPPLATLAPAAPLPPAAAGLSRGGHFGQRIELLAWGSLVVSCTSTSTELTDALRSLLAPLRVLRVPVDDVATTLSLAVRFIPLTAEELARVRDAQWSRGAALGEGLGARLRAGAGMMAPLFVGLFRRADALARAMDARCYGAPGPRTSLGARRLGAREWAALAAGLALCVAVALL